MKKNLFVLSLVLGLVMVSFAGPASAASLNLSSGNTIALGASNVVVTGTCSNSTIHVPIVLEQGGSSTTVALATRPDNGSSESYVGYANFALNIDDGFTTGPATLTAVCPEGNASVGITLIDPDGILGTPIGTSLNFNGSTNLGTSFGISGVCGTISANSGSNVVFTVTQNGTVTNLGSATTSNASGNFSGNVAFGNGIVAGPAVITATCPGTGNVITSSVNITDPNAVVVTPTPTPTPTPTTPTPTPSPSGDVGGVSTTPVGGVAAGKNLNFAIGLALISLGAAGFVFSALRKTEVSLR